MPDSPLEAFSHVIPRGTEEGRADKVLAAQFADVSRNRVQLALDAGRITRGGKPLGRRDVLRAGDALSIAWVPEPDLSAHAVSIPLEILFEDEHMLAVNKPAGLVTHPGHGTVEPTLVHALLHHTGGQLSSVGAPERPGIVHRLDKETSGVMVVARTDLAHHRLAEQFSARETRKEYLAWVLGEPARESGRIDAPVGRHPVVRTRMAVHAGGRPALTDWRVETRTGRGATLLRCRIHTGRTHQIRVHLASIGHPLLGDGTYGYKARGRPWEPVRRVMLHACLLELSHPVTSQALRLEALLPEDFRQFREIAIQ